MNKWKVAFFLLLFTIVACFIGIFVWATSSSEDVSVPKAVNTQKDTDSVLLVESTAKDFEKLVNKLISKELGTNTLPFQLNITTNVELLSELQVFGITVPISMYFDPEVKEDGNIRLKQTSVNVGNFNLPPETVLKLLNDTMEFPSWIIILPESKEIHIDLSRVEVMDDVIVKAKQFDLERNKVILEIIISND